MKYSTLLFDLDQTLLDFNHDIREAFFSMCRKQKLTINDELFNSYHAINEKWWGKLEKGLCTKEELFIERFKEWIQKHQLSADSHALSQAIFPELAHQATLFPGAYELIETLAQDHSIYFATNGNYSSQLERLKISGLDQFSKRMFVSEDIGAAKPDKRFFDFAFTCIEDKKENCLLIGDSLTSDIAGACNSGIDSVWYNPQHLPNQTSYSPTYEIHSYHELYSIV